MDSSTATELTDDEILGGQTLGKRLAEVSGIMSGKRVDSGGCMASVTV